MISRLALVLALLSSASLATADETPMVCTVRVIHAADPVTDAAGATPLPPKLDPRIDRLRPFLLRPPFTAWRVFELLDSKTLDMIPHTAQSFTLPNGKNGALTLLEHLPDTGRRHHRVRMQLELGMGTPNSLKTVFVIDEGGIVLQAGQPHRHGMLVLGTSCTESPAR